jgi:hypothetical protein
MSRIPKTDVKLAMSSLPCTGALHHPKMSLLKACIHPMVLIKKTVVLQQLEQLRVEIRTGRAKGDFEDQLPLLPGEKRELGLVWVQTCQ